MTLNYLGGYYLIRLRPVTFGAFQSKVVYAASGCINERLLDKWAYSAHHDEYEQIEATRHSLQIGDDAISAIREWVDASTNCGRLSRDCLFHDAGAAEAYRQKFFSRLADTAVIGIYFTEAETDALLHEFNESGKITGADGLFGNLKQRIPEKESIEEVFIGCDIIGVEADGRLHSFHCHDCSKELIERFDLSVNSAGLFEDIADWQPVLQFMNDEQNGFLEVPWFICRIKLVQ